jgi:endonuclease-3
LGKAPTAFIPLNPKPGIVAERLAREYGKRRWVSDEDPLDSLIGTILSQNTSDVNSGRAFASLKRKFPSWEGAESATSRQIASAIRKGGLAGIKSRRIKAILSKIKRKTGRLDLGFLNWMSLRGGYDYLRSYKGVGPKTAACVLLFACRKPVFPVDTHILRIAKKLHWAKTQETAESFQERVQDLIPKGWVYSLHINMIAHGRGVCRSRLPKCGECVLIKLCPSAFKIN